MNETTTQQLVTKTDGPQKIQVMRGPDGKMSVRGLQANQKLVQTSDGKFLIIPANQAGKLSCCFCLNLIYITYRIISWW